MIRIPVRPGVASQRLTINLDGSRYVLRFRWRERTQRWAYAIETADGEGIIRGRPVLVGRPMLDRVAHPRAPRGLLVAVDTSGADADPGFVDLGDRVTIVYTPADELAEALRGS